MEDLKVSSIQADLAWEDKKANLEMFSKKIDSISGSDLIVLPEMFNSGFTMDTAKNAETMEGKTVQWMKQTSVQKKAAVCGSIIISENSNFYNRFIWIEPKGKTITYNKRHLFRMAGEHNYFSMGNEQVIINYKGWKIAPLVCYDLRFPVWSRNKNKAFDAMIYVANWPEKRNHAWKTLLMARAIENQCYVIGVNRVGKDGNDIPYSGDSALINPLGEYLQQAEQHKEAIITEELNYKFLSELRTTFPVADEADDFTLRK